MSDRNYGTGDNRCFQSCAACKFQRRRCGPNCPLAPFFPSHSFKIFLNAHKLFGVKNILKLLTNVNPDQRLRAVSTLIDEANARAADPVGGSYRVICQLRRQIEDCKTELDDLRHQLAICRSLAIPSSLYSIQDGLISQDSFAQQLSYQDLDYQVFDERCREKAFDGSSCSWLTANPKQSLTGLIQQHPASISRGLEQLRGGMVSIGEGQEREPEIKLEDCFTHLLP